MKDHLKDHLAAEWKDPNDGVWYGVKGMKWGIRKKRESTSSSTTDASESKTKKQTYGAASDETSSGRYARLAKDAKSGGQKNWTDQDLKFFNNRTENLNKVRKQFEQKNYFKDLVAKTAKNSLERGVQNLSSKAVDQLTSQVFQSPSPSVESIIAKKVSEIQRTKAVQAGVDEILGGGGKRIRKS